MPVLTYRLTYLHIYELADSIQIHWKEARGLMDYVVKAEWNKQIIGRIANNNFVFSIVCYVGAGLLYVCQIVYRVLLILCCV